MNNGYPSVSIEDIARLAGETCVYRGAAQSMKTPQRPPRRANTGITARLVGLVTRVWR